MKKQTPDNYLKLRQKIEPLIDEIHAIADLMSLLNTDPAAINHLTAAWIGNRIKTDALQILTHLENHLDPSSEDL